MSETTRATAARAQGHGKDEKRTSAARATASASSARDARVTAVPGRATVRRRGSAGADVLGGTEVESDVASAIQRRRGGGSKLPRDVAESMGSRFGHDFSDVRVHTGNEADTLSRAVQARAFTVGSDIFFSSGAYAPGSTSGQHTLAHELTHVVQQSGGAGRTSTAPLQRSALTVGRADDGAEVEADRVADRVVKALRDPSAQEGPIEVEHTHGPGCGHEATVRRIFLGLFGTTAVAEMKEGNLDQEDQGIPNEFMDLADTIQKFEGMHEGNGKSFDDQSSFMSPTETSDAFGSLALIGSVKSTAGSMLGGGKAIKGLVEAEDSFDTNKHGVALEQSLLGLGGGVGGIAGAASGLAKNHGAKELPVVGEVMSFYNAGVKGKAAIEDSVASARLGMQKGKVKHLKDQMMPADVRIERFKEFYPAVAAYKAGKKAEEKALAAGDKKAAKEARKAIDAAKGSVKSGDVKRFVEAETAFGKRVRDTSSERRILEFLDAQPKDFGKGTEHRKKYEGDLATKAQTGSGDYMDARSLGKVASFGQRRKGETAAVNSVEAVGNALDGAGTFTAAGDMGATKISGKVLKGGAALYRGLKSGVKRARRVHKLATAKNELGYGGKSDRGFGWGLKTFFGGNIEGSMDKAKASMDGDHSGGAKVSANAGSLTDVQRAKLLRLLTLQAQRRVDDLVRCLGSDNDKIAERAAKILHIIAETNLAGAIARIKDSDIAAFRQKAKDLRAKRDELLRAKDKQSARRKPSRTAQTKIDALEDEVKALDAEVTKIGGKISDIVKEQLKGIGG